MLWLMQHDRIIVDTYWPKKKKKNCHGTNTLEILVFFNWILRCTQIAGQMGGGFFHRSAISTSTYDDTYMKFNAQDDSGSVAEKQIYKLDKIL